MPSCLPLRRFLASSLLPCFVPPCLRLFLLSTLLLCTAAGPASRPTSQPASAPTTRASRPAGTLRVWPGSIRLENARDTQQVVVVLMTPEGMTLDVTAEAELRIEPAGVARLAWDSRGRLSPNQGRRNEGQGTRRGGTPAS